MIPNYSKWFVFRFSDVIRYENYEWLLFANDLNLEMVRSLFLLKFNQTANNSVEDLYLNGPWIKRTIHKRLFFNQVHIQWLLIEGHGCCVICTYFITNFSHLAREWTELFSVSEYYKKSGTIAWTIHLKKKLHGYNSKTEL